MKSPKGRQSRKLADLDMTQATNLVMDFYIQLYREGNNPKKPVLFERGFLSSWSYIMYKDAYLTPPKRLTPFFRDRLKLLDEQLLEVNGAHLLLVADKKTLLKHWKNRITSPEYTPPILQMLSIQKYMLELIKIHDLKSFHIFQIQDDNSYHQITLEEALLLSDYSTFGKKIIMPNFRTYLAGPFFNPLQKKLIKTLENLIDEERIDLYSPSRDSIVINQDTTSQELQETFKRNYEEIDKADFMIAILDYPGSALTIGADSSKKVSLPDSGTMWELGYAYAKGKPVIGVFTEPPAKMNLMLKECLTAVTIGTNKLPKIIEEVKALIIDTKAGYDTSERKNSLLTKYSIQTKFE